MRVVRKQTEARIVWVSHWHHASGSMCGLFSLDPSCQAGRADDSDSGSGHHIWLVTMALLSRRVTCCARCVMSCHALAQHTASCPVTFLCGTMLALDASCSLSKYCMPCHAVQYHCTVVAYQDPGFVCFDSQLNLIYEG